MNSRAHHFQQSMKVHLDTDIGGDPDDLCALALLLASGVEITGITTCVEDTGRRAGYVHEVLRLAERSGIAVAAGSETGMRGLRLTPGFPDDEKYWGRDVPRAPGPPDAALDLLNASIEAGATIVAIGPFTNLALLEARRPGRLAQANLVLMGGCIGELEDGLPRWGPREDWNMNLDVAATRLVFESSTPTIVPLNVTAQVHLRARDLPKLRSGGLVAALMARQAVAHDSEYNNSSLCREHQRLPDDLLNFHHDPLACAVAIGWDGVKVEELALRLDDHGGFPVLRSALDGKRVLVVTGVDGDRFAQFWLDSVT